MAKLFLVGDSITAGAWDERGGWASRLIGFIMSRVMESDHKDGGFWCLPYNLGVSGDTVAGILKRLDNEITVRLDPYDKDAAIQIVFAIGNNDSQYLTAKDKPLFASDVFESKLRDLIALARKYTKNISFIGLLPVDEARVDPVPWAPGISYRNDSVKRIDDIIERICHEEGLGYLPMFDTWMHLPDYKSLLHDGDHPNSAGHALMAEQIAAFLLTPEFFEFHKG